MGRGKAQVIGQGLLRSRSLPHASPEPLARRPLAAAQLRPLGNAKR
jgi:hypothetical protein